MRTLGRPNREQVVTTRPSELTTLEAIELSNGQPLTDLLKAGADKLVKTHEGCLRHRHLPRRIRRRPPARPHATAELDRVTAITGNTLTAETLADALWCIVMLPEFQL